MTTNQLPQVSDPDMNTPVPLMQLATAFWQQDVLSGKIVHTWTWANLQAIRDDSAIHTVTRHTVQMAVLVTLTDMLLAFPLAYYMVRIASRRTRALLFLGVLMPLWSSYLIKAYTWRLMTGDQGTINWALDKIGLGPVHIAYTSTAMWLAFSYAALCAWRCIRASRGIRPAWV